MVAATAVDQELEAELQQLSPPELRHVIRVLADNSDENQRSRTQDIASHLHAYIAHRSMETASGSGSAGGKAAPKTSSFDSPVKEVRDWILSLCICTRICAATRVLTECVFGCAMRPTSIILPLTVCDLHTAGPQLERGVPDHCRLI